jgi:serine phosphatase RsbU (regulator of sigma subunit)
LVFRELPFSCTVNTSMISRVIEESAPSRARWELSTALSVLLVEDDDDDALLVADLLETTTLRLDRVATAGEAATWLRATPADCVLLDLGLPDASGLEAIGALLAPNPAIAVVVLTGDSDEQRGIEALGAGAEDYLVKGRIDTGTLLRAIRYGVERKSAERGRQELAVARTLAAENSRLQRGLLPDPIVGDPRITIAAAYRPGGRRLLLGGDFYDVVQDAGGRTHAVIGDVCGHGPDEAALGVRLRMAWRTLVLAGAPDDELLATLDRVLEHERDDAGLFTSVATVIVESDCRSATVRLAGHPEPFVIDDAMIRPLGPCANGRVLGIGGARRWPATVVELGDDWELLLYTDGLYEGRAGHGSARLGIGGLLDVMAASSLVIEGAKPDVLSDLIGEIEELNGSALRDDVAILALTCTASAGSA